MKVTGCRVHRASRCLPALAALLLVLALVLSQTGAGAALAGPAPGASAGPGSPATAAPPQGYYLVGFKGLPDQALVRSLGGEIRHSYTIVPALAARLPEAAAAALRGNPNVAYVEPDGLAYALDGGPAYVLADTIPWGVDRIDADLVHATGNLGQGVNVGIIDTGIDSDHPDLAVAGGVTFVAGTTTWEDDHGHGTHIAGIAAALANGSGIVGVAPGCSLYAIKVLNAQGSGYWSDVVAGIDWAVANGLQVINMSLGGPTDVTTLREACDNAYAAGLVLVAPTGGSGDAGSGDNVGYPARYDSVIAVAATDASDLRAPFSSTGPSVELAAPGVNIYSTYLGGGYMTMSGTSMACPHVAGVAALVFCANPSFSGADVRWAMDSTAIDLGPPGRDNWYGYGLVYAPAAVGGSPPPPALSVAVATDKAAYSGKTVRVKVTTTVTDPGGLAVSGVAVHLDIVAPGGATRTADGATGADGKWFYSFYLYSSKDPKGTYTVTATASKTGYTPGTGQTTFVYK